MADNYGEFIFPGVTDVLSAQYTLSHGISPGVCTITSAKQPQPKKSGELQLKYAGKSLKFPDCLVDKVEMIAGDDGVKWQTTILDRRWLWRQFNFINGFFNVRRDEDTIQPGTEMILQDLARGCLKSMNEVGFDLSALAGVKMLPEVLWDLANPAEELAKLCEAAKVLICPTLAGKVKLWKLGQGATLPVYPILEGGAAADPPDPPEKLTAYAGRTRYQHDFELEPVGLEPSGEIVPLDKLSYTPQIGGAKTWKGYADIRHFNGLGDKTAREFAKRSVYRWYRIKAPFTLPEFGKVDSLDRILPLESKQIEHTLEVVPGSQLKQRVPRAPWIWGKFHPGHESRKPAEDNPAVALQRRPKGFYNGGFSVDTERGIVMFSDPIFLYDQGKILPAEIKLRIACSLRDKAHRHWKRHSLDKPLSGGKAKFVRVIRRDDLSREIHLNNVNGALKDNEREVNERLREYLDATAKEYEPKISGSATYAGFLPLQLDGAIQQISWILSAEGYAYTRASRNREESFVAPSFSERRIFEQLAAQHPEWAQSPRARANNDAAKRG
jgi:hypothetical protein